MSDVSLLNAVMFVVYIFVLFFINNLYELSFLLLILPILFITSAHSPYYLFSSSHFGDSGIKTAQIAQNIFIIK